MMTLECEASILCVCNDLINLFPKRFCANNGVYLWVFPSLAYLIFFYIKFVYYRRLLRFFFLFYLSYLKEVAFLIGIKSIKKDIIYFTKG